MHAAIASQFPEPAPDLKAIAEVLKAAEKIAEANEKLPVEQSQPVPNPIPGASLARGESLIIKV